VTKRKKDVLIYGEKIPQTGNNFENYPQSTDILCLVITEVGWMMIDVLQPLLSTQ